jgi:WD40 repeat protein
MMHFFIGTRQSWDKYLKESSFFKGLKGEIRRTSQKERVAISEQTQQIVASREALTRKFADGFDSINVTLEAGFGRLEDVINGAGGSIDALRASFDYGVALLVEQFQVQNQHMLHLLHQMDAVHATLENPTMTQAREFYRIGCDRLAKGLLDKALEAFEESAKKDDANFMTQLLIGKLYLYGVNEECNIVDLKKAEAHLRAAARFAKAEARLLPEATRYAGEALLHASIASYAQANEKVLQGNTGEAQQLLQNSFDLAKQAAQTAPQLSESFYHQAKFAALLGDGKTAAESLQRAIELDEAYCLKADSDVDFRFVLSDVNQLFHGLRNKSAGEVGQKLEQCELLLTEWVYQSLEAQNAEEEMRRLLDEARRCLDRNTYFDNRDALAFMHKAEQLFKSLLVHKSVHHSIAAHTSRVNSLAFSADQTLLASGGGDGAIHLWRMPDHELLFTLRGHEEAITHLVFSHNSRLLASVDRKGNVKLWHAAAGALMCDLMPGGSPVHCVAFSPDDTKLAVGGYDRQATVWEVMDGSLLYNLTGHKSSVDAVVFSSNGRWLATGSPDNTAWLWDLNTGQPLQTFFGCSGLSNCLAFHSNDTILICGASDGSVRFYNVNEGKLLYNLPERSSTVSWMALSADSKVLATVHYGKAIQLWDVQNAKLLYNLKPFSPGVTSVRFSPDGLMLAASDYQDRSVKLWNTYDGKLMHVIAGNLTCAEFSPDGALLVTGDETGSLKFWGRMVVTRKAFEASRKRHQAPPSPTSSAQPAMRPQASARIVQSNPHPANGAASRTNSATSRYHAQPVEPAGFVKPGTNGAVSPGRRPAERTSPHDNPFRFQAANAPQPSSPARPKPHAAAPSSAKTVQAEAAVGMNNNPYDLELERLLEKQQRQAEKMEKMGRCLECGKKLGFFAKAWGLKFCKQHGF